MHVIGTLYANQETHNIDVQVHCTEAIKAIVNSFELLELLYLSCRPNYFENAWNQSPAFVRIMVHSDFIAV